MTSDLPADCEGRSDDPVQLELQGKSSKNVLATWTEAAVARSGRYDAGLRNENASLPKLPAEFVPVQEGL